MVHKVIPLKKKWVSTDAWRGYYTFDNSIADGWMQSISDSGDSHNDTEKDRMKAIQKVLKLRNIPYRTKYSRTSNVFSVGWDIVVAPSDKARADKIAKAISRSY